MSLEVLLAGCYLMLSACAFFLFRIDSRGKKGLDLYGEALLNVQKIELERLDEMRKLRAVETQRLIETRKLTQYMSRSKH